MKEGSLRGGMKTKAGTNRLVPIHSRIKPLIEEQLNPNGTYLFEYNRKAYYSAIIRVNFVKSLNRFGINHTPHECRHTTATLLDKYGANPVTIKNIPGHSTQDLTSSVYIHKNLEELKKAINLIP